MALVALAVAPLRAQTPAASPPATTAKPGTADEIAKLVAVYQTAAEGIVNDREKWVNALDIWYTASLDKLLEERRIAGDLDGMVAVKNEQERVARHTATTPEQVQAMFPAMRTLRGTFETNFNRVVGELMRRSTAADQKYLADLETLQKRLTVSALIDEAVQVKAERDRFAALLDAGSAPAAAPEATGGRELIGAIIPPHAESPIVLTGHLRLDTNEKFRPLVEITIVAKIINANLRLAYAADQLIFNWDQKRTQLRVDGGPAAGKHKDGAGEIPKDTFVTIRWRVTPKQQLIYVDDQLRYQHDGDYSKIDKPVSVFAYRSTVTVQSIKVLQLPPGTE